MVKRLLKYLVLNPQLLGQEPLTIFVLPQFADHLFEEALQIILVVVLGLFILESQVSLILVLLLLHLNVEPLHLLEQVVPGFDDALPLTDFLVILQVSVSVLKQVVDNILLLTLSFRTVFNFVDNYGGLNIRLH